MNTRSMSPAEAAVMEGLMPGRVAESTAVLALCLYEALVLGDARAGTKKPAGEWQQQLEAWAHQVIDQIRHVSAELGGSASTWPRTRASGCRNATKPFGTSSPATTRRWRRSTT